MTLFRYSLRQFFDTRTDSTFSRYLSGFYHFSVLTQIRPFSGTRWDSFSILVRILPFPGTRLDSTFFLFSDRFDPFPVLVGTVFRYSYAFYLSQYSSGFYHFSVLTQIRPFAGTPQDSFSILVRILAFPDTRPDSTIFRYSHRFDPFRYSLGQFFDTRTDSTFSRYSPGFDHISVLTHIRPFFGTRWDSFSILVRNISFPGTRPDSTIFQYSDTFDPFPVLPGTVFRYSYGFYLFPVLVRILPFFGTHTESTLF